MGSVEYVVSSSQNLLNLSTFKGANFDYIAKDGNNMRVGNIAGVWNGTISSHNELNTTDLGNTSPVTFTLSNVGVLNATVSSGTWTIEVLYRAFGK